MANSASSATYGAGDATARVQLGCVPHSFNIGSTLAMTSGIEIEPEVVERPEVGDPPAVDEQAPPDLTVDDEVRLRDLGW